MAEELRKVFAKLTSDGIQSPRQGAFLVLPIGESSKHLLGVTSIGEPCVLIDAKAQDGFLAAPLRLHGMEVQYSVPCRVILHDGTTLERVLTTILCTSRDSTEQEYFLHAADILLQIVGAEPTLTVVMNAVARLTEIFQRLAQPQRRSLTGLLGELMLILRSPSPRDAVMAWRSAADDTFDFAAADLRVEVKATQGRQRVHFLSYAQCHPPEGTTGVLVSVIVEAAGGGTSLEEILRELKRMLIDHHDAVMRLHEIVAEALGNTLKLAMSERFDRALAEQSILLFALNEVPAIREALPRGVSQVRFASDLSNVASKTAGSFYGASETARLLLPL